MESPVESLTGGSGRRSTAPAFAAHRTVGDAVALVMFCVGVMCVGAFRA